MNVLMLYPKFPEQTFWNTTRSIKLLWGRRAIMPPLGLLTIAAYLPEDFSVRLVDRNVAEKCASDWEWADVVSLSVMMAQREDYRQCVAQAKMRGKPIAVGGPFTHALPELRAPMRIGCALAKQKRSWNGSCAICALIIAANGIKAVRLPIWSSLNFPASSFCPTSTTTRQ
jgi:hypothetical protein